MNKTQDFKAKADESNEAAKLCKINKLFSASINRYYYSVIQFMFYILDSKGLQLSEAEKQTSSSHELTKHKISSLCKNNSTLNPRQFLGDFSSIKKLRQQADYEKIKFDLEDCNQMEKNIYSMQLYLTKLIEEKK